MVGTFTLEFKTMFVERNFVLVEHKKTL
eukprot:SAG31_NODE_3222_length_4523_cov_2.551085_1_plen_27_part_10